MLENVLPMISSRSFMVSCLILKSVNHFIFVHSIRVCCSFVDLQLTFPATLAEETAFLGFYILTTPVKTDWLMKMGYFWVLCSVPLICGSHSVLVSHCFDHCGFLVLSEVWKGYVSCFVLFPQCCFGNCWSFYDFISILVYLL